MNGYRVVEVLWPGTDKVESVGRFHGFFPVRGETCVLVEIDDGKVIYYSLDAYVVRFHHDVSD